MSRKGSRKVGKSKEKKEEKVKEVARTEETNTTPEPTFELPREEELALKDAFMQFEGNERGKVPPAQLKDALKSHGYETKNPTIFGMIVDLDTNEAEEAGGIEFDELKKSVNDKMNRNAGRDDIRKIFDLFVDDPSEDTININSLRKIAKDLGESFTIVELAEMLQNASYNGSDITFDEFYEIMTRN